MKRWRRFLGVPAKEKWLLAESLLTVGVASVAVAAMPFSILQSWVTRKPHLKARKNVSLEQIGWAVSAASRFVPGSTCLAEALATKVLMRRYGYESVICVGVRKGKEGEFAAHAWVESGAEVVTGGEKLSEYHRLPEF